MKFYKKFFSVITVFLFIVIAGMYACQNNQSENSSGTTISNEALRDSNVADLLASINMYHFPNPVKSPDFELISVEGNKTRLSQYRGKVVLLSFWATW